MNCVILVWIFVLVCLVKDLESGLCCIEVYWVDDVGGVYFWCLVFLLFVWFKVSVCFLFWFIYEYMKRYGCSIIIIYMICFRGNIFGDFFYLKGGVCEKCGVMEVCVDKLCVGINMMCMYR